MNNQDLFKFIEEHTVTVEEASSLIQGGMTIGMSGWAMSGYPKAIVNDLVRRKKNEKYLKINLITGANTPWIDDCFASADLLLKRAPMIASRTLSQLVNEGHICYVEQQMSRMPDLIDQDCFGQIDIAVIEAIGFDSQGYLIPSSSVGLTPHLIEQAKMIIVEINHSYPSELKGLHDIYIPNKRPGREPIPLIQNDQRIGRSSIPIDLRKVAFIVETNLKEEIPSPSRSTNQIDLISNNLFSFLEEEFKGFEDQLPPIQMGFGGVADGIAKQFLYSKFNNLEFFCGGVTEPVMELLASQKVHSITTGGVGFSQRVRELFSSIPNLKEHLFIRNGDITNSNEVISRFGLLALNTGIEIDIYGNVNASHIAGSRVINGIGGGASFAQNSGLSIILIPSFSKGGDISNIVPMVFHQDIGEHDIDILITDQGIADLRGLDDKQRAISIINNCSAPTYKGALKSYLNRAINSCGGHHPQCPVEAFSWYQRLKEEGSMLEKKSE